jgi:hypothetical protein
MEPKIRSGRKSGLGHFRPTLRVSRARCLLFPESDLITCGNEMAQRAMNRHRQLFNNLISAGKQ